MFSKSLFIQLLFACCPFFLFSQIVLPEATLTYDFSVETEGKATPLDTNISGQKFIVYLKGALSRTDHISSLGRDISVFDSKSGTGFLTREYSGQKLLARVTAEEWQEEYSFYRSLDFKTDEGTYPVLGYSCRKTKELKQPGKIYHYTIYYDPSIQTPNKTYDLAFPQLGGLPVRIEMRFENTVYRFELSGLAREVINPSLFETPRKGYNTISYSEMKSMKNRKDK